MASMQNISRLYVTQPNGAAESAPVGQPEPERVKLPDSGNLQIDVSNGTERRVRGRFRLTSSQPEGGYTLSAPEVMSIMSAALPQDQAGRFAGLAETERAQRLIEQFVAARATGRRSVGPVY